MTDMRAGIAALSTRLERLSDPRDAAELMHLLRLLYAAGRADLPMGRLFEGHVDALQIVTRYGDERQRVGLAEAVAEGALLGVWNADLPDDPLRREGMVLHGGKSFASGAGILSHALVTFDAAGGRQLALVDLERTPPAIDRGWWHTIGMQRSETHLVRWQGGVIQADDLIGAPGDYVREPWFSGGALRFAAVQAGGIAALVDRTSAHLVATGRAADPHQATRLAALFAHAEAASAAVRRAAEAWFDEGEATTRALIAAARASVYANADAALTLAQQAVGVQGMFTGHPLAAVLSDLAVYLRQPAPDAQRMQVAAALAAGHIGAAL